MRGWFDQLWKVSRDYQVWVIPSWDSWKMYAVSSAKWRYFTNRGWDSRCLPGWVSIINEVSLLNHCNDEMWLFVIYHVVTLDLNHRFINPLPNIKQNCPHLNQLNDVERNRRDGKMQNCNGEKSSVTESNIQNDCSLAKLSQFFFKLTSPTSRESDSFWSTNEWHLHSAIIHVKSFFSFQFSFSSRL